MRKRSPGFGPYTFGVFLGSMANSILSISLLILASRVFHLIHAIWLPVFASIGLLGGLAGGLVSVLIVGRHSWKVGFLTFFWPLSIIFASALPVIVLLPGGRHLVATDMADVWALYAKNDYVTLILPFIGTLVGARYLGGYVAALRHRREMQMHLKVFGPLYPHGSYKPILDANGNLIDAEGNLIALEGDL